MTDSVREQILSALATALGSVTGFSGLVVERDRDTEVDRFPMLVVIGGDQSAEEIAGSQVTRYGMNVAVAGFIRPTTNSEAAGKQANALYAAMLAEALSDRTLGGLCVDIAEGDTQFSLDAAEGHQRLGSFETQFLITYFTATGDPLTAANP